MLNKSDLRPAQDKIITRLYENSALLAVLGMGGGKTASALTAFEELQNDGHVSKGVIIAPPLVAASVWPREAAKWSHLKDIRVVHLAGGPAERKKTLDAMDGDLFSVSINLIPWLANYLEKLPTGSPLLDLLLIDETSKLKGPRSSWGKALSKVTPRIGTRWGLTGTPRPNGYEDLFMPMRVLTAGNLWGDNFDQWRRENFMPMDYHGYEWRIHDFRAQKLIEDLNTVMVTIPDEEMPTTAGLNAGPEHNYEVDLPDEVREVYDTMEKHLVVEVVKNLHKGATEVDLVAALSHAVASSKLEQIAQGYLYDDGEASASMHTHKIDMLNDMLSSADGENVLIAYKYKYDLEILKKHLGKDLVQLGGGGAERAVKMMDKWNEGKIKYLALHPASAGHGVELQHGGHRIIWFCPTWSPEMYDQTLKRLDRPAQTHPVFSHQIIARDTVDEVKVNRVQYRMEDQDAFKRMLRMA